ncbi:MAG TPA: methyltransferase domain-containing protein [Acidobacteriota bacterium]|nr:methyltransferase domain-containing protein [Acidobacteriota bacterium]
MEARFDADLVARFENETWSRCAKGYTDGFGPLVTEGIAPLLDAVSVSASDRVLDVGTGPGLVAAAASERGAEAVGVDFSETMLEEARRGHPDIEFHTGSAEALPFGNNGFDVVVGNFVLHHSGNPTKVLEEAFRVLRPKGRMGFTVWADPSKLEAFGLFFAAVEEHAGAAELPHGPLFGVSDFTIFHKMLAHAGFHDSAVRELEIAWRTSSMDSFLAAFRDWANLEAFPSDVRQAIEGSVRERSAAYRHGDVYTIPNPAILVSAVK